MNNKQLKRTPQAKRARAHTGGRKTASNEELWARRIKVLRLWSMGVTKSEIAHQFNLAPNAITSDLEAMAMIEPADEAKKKIAGHITEIIRKAFEKINQDDITESSKIEYFKIITDACQKLSRLHGIERDTNIVNLSQTLNTISVAGANRYDKWTDDKLQAEFKRRRLEAGTSDT
jgi:transcriptional regulator